MGLRDMEFGRISIIWGDKGSRFPYCNSLFIDDKIRAVIDPASEVNALKEIARQGIDQIINSHYHFDHIRFNYIFNNADIWVPKFDKNAMTDRYKYVEKYGALRVQGKLWIHELMNILKKEKEPSSAQNSFTYDHTFYLSIGKVSSTFSDHDIISFGKERVETILTSGHSDSMCSFYFPIQSLCYVSDYNVLSEWGPWYGGEDSDIVQLLSSAIKLKKIDAKYFLTAHDQKIMTKDRFLKHLDEFLSIIQRRNDKIAELVMKGIDFNQLSNVGIFYDKKYFNIHWVRIWETMMLIKHLEYMGLDNLIPHPLRSKSSHMTPNTSLI